MTEQRILAFLLLMICSYTDLKNRTVDLRIVLGMTAVSGVISLWYGNSITKVIITYAIILTAGFLLNRIAGLGEGDAYVIGALGIMLNGSSLLFVLFAGSLLASVTGILLKLSGTGEEKADIPFVPFVFAGFLFMLGIRPEFIL